MTLRKTILYIGAFELPDKNAAALRVVSNAKALNELGYSVMFMGISHETSTTEKGIGTPKSFENFIYYERKYPQSFFKWVSYSVQINLIKEIIHKYNRSIDGIIFYNYPAVAMCRLIGFCKRNSIWTISDCTEWYYHSKKTFLGIIKTIDSEFRMRVCNKSVDGIIAISRYLEKYYQLHVPTVFIPPLVDCEDTKWKNIPRVPHDEFTLVYAGSPGMKDRLDILVIAVIKCELPINLKIIGIEEKDFLQLYPNFKYEYLGNVSFLGRLSHSQAIIEISNSDYTCFFRDQSRLSQAGFPTKFVESITAGIPVITNATSNISEYRIKLESCIILDALDIKSVIHGIRTAFSERKRVKNTTIFDYRNYNNEFSKLIVL